MESPNRPSPASDRSLQPSGLPRIVTSTLNRGYPESNPSLRNVTAHDSLQTAGPEVGGGRTLERQLNEGLTTTRTFPAQLHPPHTHRHQHHRHGSRHAASNHSAEDRHHWPRRLFYEIADWESDKDKMRDGHHRFRDTRIPRTVTQFASSTGAGARKLLPGLTSHKERDREPYGGLLKPVPTHESQWSSRPSTRPSSESRRGSFIDDNDLNAKLGQIKRKKIKTKADLEREKRKREKGEESLRSTLSSIATLAADITRRLDYTYYNLLERISNLHVTINSFQELADSSAKLFVNFQHEKDRIDREYRAQIEDFNSFKSQLEKVHNLEKRMTTSKEKASALNTRLDAVRKEINGWERREVEWQARTSRRLRILWAIMGTLIVLVILIAIVQGLPSSYTGPLVDSIASLANPSRRSSSRRTSYQDAPLPSLDLEVPLYMDINRTDEVDPLWSFLREANTCARVSIPGTTPTSPISPYRTDSNTNQDDPLTIFDEL